MRHIKTDIKIKAPIGRVWDILATFSGYNTWNPFIIQASGEAKVGEKLMITLRPKPKQTFKFSPVLTTVVPGNILIWKGKFLFPGLFDGEHKFRLIEDGKGTKLIQEELFSGILPPILPQSMFDHTKAGFEAMNVALKQKAEKI